MNQLINIQQQTIGDDIINAVSARELHYGLDLKKDFTDWVKNILQDFVEGIDFIEVHSKVNINNVKMTEYLFSLDMAKQIAMLTRTPKGKEVRLYFIECEKKLNKPKTALELAREQVALLEALEAKQLELDNAIKTKAYISDKKTATALNTASQLSKELGKAKDYATVKRVEMATGQKYKWKALKDYSLANNLDMPMVFDVNYGEVRSYNADAWFNVYSVDILELK